jgi:hypothetical protein
MLENYELSSVKVDSEVHALSSVKVDSEVHALSSVKVDSCSVLGQVNAWPAKEDDHWC